MHDRAHERARRQVDVGAGRRDRVDHLRCRHGLAGQDGLVTLELDLLEDADVGGDDVADVQRHHVAGHEIGHRDPGLRAVAGHQRLVADVRVQRGDRALGAVLVDEAQADAEHHDRGDDPAVGGLTRGRGHEGRGEQQDEQRVAQLSDEHPERGDPVLGEDVATEPGAPLLDLRRGEPAFAAAERRQHVTDGLSGSRLEVALVRRAHAGPPSSVRSRSPSRSQRAQKSRIDRRRSLSSPPRPRRSRPPGAAGGRPAAAGRARPPTPRVAAGSAAGGRPGRSCAR